MTSPIKQYRSTFTPKKVEQKVEVQRPVKNISKPFQAAQGLKKSSKQVVYRKLPNGVEFTGTLNSQGCGTKCYYTDYQQQYFLQNCTVQNNMITHYERKGNLISQQRIVDSPPKPLQLIGLCHRLYEQYLKQQNLDHKIIVFFNEETDQFINTTKSSSDHKTFESSYCNFTKIFLYIKFEISFALVVIKNNLYVLINDINMDSSRILREKEEKLAQIGYKVSRLMCPVLLSQQDSENKSSKLNGYFMIPLLSKAFNKNGLTESNLKDLSSICNQIKSRNQKTISWRIDKILNNHKETLEFIDFYNNLSKSLYSFKKYKYPAKSDE